VTRTSVVVPVYDDAGSLRECLAALRATVDSNVEIVVVDDGSRDDSAAVATAAGVRLLRLERNGGVGPARNRGVRVTSGDVIVFVDADVVVAPGSVAGLVRELATRPEIAAVFGSYDATPRAPGFVSQYRNLLHHFVHQAGNREASTFWAGCGAIRRSAFEAVGGFAEGPLATPLEDVDLGYRLRAAGHRIALVPEIQGTHLKRWTLASVVRTDALKRALPWARLMLRHRPPADLNIQGRQRLSVALTLVAVALLPIAVVRPWALAAAAAAVLGVVVANHRLLRSFAGARGLPFALATVPMLLLQYLESGVCYAWAWLTRPAAR
jgi:GT2 family glycosyltransferase